MPVTELNDLNKKLAEWAGFNLRPTQRSFNTIDWPEYSWHTPQGEILWSEDMLPNFTESLDACFKWLVSNIKDEDTYASVLFGWLLSVITDKQDPPLALCLAIEKLIDKEKAKG